VRLFKVSNLFNRVFIRNMLVLLCFVRCEAVQGQIKDSPIIAPATIYQGDTIALVNLPTIDIIAAMSPMAAQKFNQYYKLRRDVLKAYPYAKLAGRKLKEINENLKKIPGERARKAYIKKTEKELKDQFEKDLKNLTVNQGKILIKLIDRETGNTSYALVKDLRSSFQAFIWQGVARLFSLNLKTEYDPEGDDQLIELIVRGIENGDIPLKNP
jgi:hypothetical protein